MPEPRRTFVPVLLLGLASATLGAVAGTKPWATVTESNSDVVAPGASALYADAGQMPLAGALSLVVLAAWGVLLVTRGRVRRVVAVVGAVAALGVVVTVLVGWSSTRDDVLEALQITDGSAETGLTGWYWTAAVSAVLSLLATVLAARYVGHWPAMGSRYDAPGARPAPTLDPAEAGEGELWCAIDEGHDPTA